MKLDFLQQFNQTNKGDRQGTIWATKNIDPDINPGKVNVSKLMGFRTDTSSKSNLGAPAWGFTFSSDVGTAPRYFAVADDRCWETSNANPNGGWTEMSNTPTDIDSNSDIIAFNSKIYIATSNNLKSFDGNFGGGTFANISGGLGASPHSMTVYANRLYVSDLSDNVYSMNTSESLSKTGSNTIDLNTVTGISQEITKIESVSNGIWIATVYSDRAGGEMIFWDGETENVTSNRYKMPRGVLSMDIKDDRPYVIDSLGRLRVFDGTTFPEISRLPIKNEDLDNFNDTDNDRFIHPNGMVLVNDEVYILVSNTMDDPTQAVIEQMPSGVWAWNPAYGFYHKYSIADFDVVSGTQKDFGTSEVVQVGALFRSDASGGSSVDRGNQSEILAGFQYYSDATTSKAAIGITNVVNTLQKSGQTVTVQASAKDFDEIWQEIIAVYDRFNNDTDKIVLKYRTYETEPVYATGTWSNDTLLRSTDDLSSVQAGDEIEILRGNGSGVCAHVDSITSTYRVKLDENPLSGMAGTCKFRVQKWQKIGTAQDTDEQFIRKTLDANSAAWVQFKVFIVGKGMSPQLQKLISISKSNNKI